MPGHFPAKKITESWHLNYVGPIIDDQFLIPPENQTHENNEQSSGLHLRTIEQEIKITRYIFPLLQRTKKHLEFSLARLFLEEENKLESLHPLYFELTHCGIGIEEGLCQYSSFAKSLQSHVAKIIEFDHHFTYYKVLKTNSTEHLLIALQINKDESKPFFLSSGLYKFSSKHSTSIFDDFEKGLLQKVTNLPFSPPNFYNFITYKKMNIPTSRFLHLMQSALNKDDIDLPYSTIINRYIKSEFDRARLSTKLSFLEIARNERLRFHRDDLIDLYHLGMNYKGSKVEEESALGLAELSISSPRVHQILLNSLNHTDWKIKLRAIKTISNISVSKNDEFSLLAKIEDSDFRIQNAAYQYSSKIRLENIHLPILANILANNDPQIRMKALMIINQVNSPESTTLILKSLEDKFSDVQQLAYSLAVKRTLGIEHFNYLKTLLHQNNETLQEQSARLIGKIPSTESANTLIQAINEKQSEAQFLIVSALRKMPLTPDQINQIILSMEDQDTGGKIINILTFWEITDRQIPVLKKTMQSSLWNSRRTTAILLQKNKSPKATKALIEMSGETDSEILKEVMYALKDRPISDELINTINYRIAKADRDWRTKIRLIQFLSDNDSMMATKSLVSLIPDNHRDIRSAIQLALRDRPLTPELISAMVHSKLDPDNSDLIYYILSRQNLKAKHLPIIIPMANHPNWKIRKNGVTLITLIPGELSTQFLLTKLWDEDSDVRKIAKIKLIKRDILDSHINYLYRHKINYDSNWNLKKLYPPLSRHQQL